MGTAVILPDLILPSRANQRWLYSGMDSTERCLNKQHFLNYPYTVDYMYNSRGFRDQEWPDSDLELRDAIWCLGDSFTVGIGQPLAHIWPQVLATATGRRCINISMDGASNDWIWRRTQDIRAAIQPRHMVIMWSYTHRRELPDSSLEDEQRRVSDTRDSHQQDLAHWTDLVNKVHALDNTIVQCRIPDWHSYDIESAWNDIKDANWPRCPRTMSEFERLPDWIVGKLESLHGTYNLMKRHLLVHKHGILPVAILQDAIDAEKALDWDRIIHVEKRLDWARDYHHFDILTSHWVVDQIMPRLTA